MPSILAIDDDPSILSLIGSIAASLGCEYRGAPSIEDGERELEAALPDLLIVDGLLPDGTGIELLARVLPAHEKPPKSLFLSAFFKGFRTFEELYRLGVDKVIHKPVTPESLTKEIADLLGMAPTSEKDEEDPGKQALRSELAKLQAKFIEALPEKRSLIETLAGSTHHSDLAELQQQVHRLAGTAGTYGLPTISEAAYQVDRALQTGKSVSEVRDLLDDLLHQLSEARPSKARAEEEDKATHRLLKFRQVLFVHRESSSADLLRAELSNAGLLIESAAGPEEATHLAGSLHPDIVIAECCEEVSDEEIAGLSKLRQALDPSVPIIFLTAHEDLDRRVAASLAGGAMFLTMPVTGTEVLQTIQKCLTGNEVGGPILVVDDDAAMLKLAEKVLSSDGLQVRGVANPQEFWDALEREHPSLIVMDVHLPVYSGYELCRVIKSDPRFRDIPVMMLTARNDVSDRIAAFQAGADDFLAKPVVPEEFIARVRARMRKAEEAASRGLKDRLTGLLSRAAMEEILDRALRQFRRTALASDGKRAGVLLIDIDDLSELNKTRGNRAGDAALQLVADSFDQAVRPGDSVCRWGGEEFAVLLGDASENNYRATFERLQQFLTRHPIETDDGPPIEVHVSAGGARFEAGDTPLSLLRRADAALYWAKERGKNRLELESSAASREGGEGGPHKSVPSFQGMIGGSLAMQEPFRRIRLAAQSDVTVLLRGESGTGKELAARAIHDLSERHEKPFIAVNCSALPESLLESELFGHVRGAFTGAHRDKTGVFESARGGTLFLDEIGDVSPLIQLKLLRVLQEREIRRVGGDKAIPVDVRVVTATNKDLEKLIENEVFREDFYYRIRVFEITLPPLRDRTDDIPLLIDALVAEFSRTRGKPVRGLTSNALERLCQYPWPGNVRELRNAIEHGFVTVRGDRITLEDLPPELREAESGSAPTRRQNEPTERERIVSALRHSQGNRTRAAETLGISRVTLWKKIAKYEIDVEAIA